VGIFLGINSISHRARLPSRTPGQLRAAIVDSVSHAVDRGLKVRFTVEDGGRTDPNDLLEVFQAALRAGSQRVCFADTVGSLEPSAVGAAVARLRHAFPGVEIEAHLHDDRGLALANALAAIDNGADWISTSVNGLGERAGIVDLAALSMNLYLRGTRRLTDGKILTELSTLVGAFSRAQPDARRPVVGSQCFHHSAALHVQAVQRDPRSYECIDPAIFGRERQCGVRAVSREPKELVLRPPVISATELRRHRHGPGDRYVLIDDRFCQGAGQYCIARRIPLMSDYGEGHVDSHRHSCDSLFVFLGEDDNYEGLTVDVLLDGDWLRVESPVSVFIPAAMPHGYRVVAGSGTYLNHVLAGNYNSSLLNEPDRDAAT